MKTFFVLLLTLLLVVLPCRADKITLAVDPATGVYSAATAADLEFTPSGAPASRTLQSKLGESVSILDFNPTAIDIGDGENHLLGDIYASYAAFNTAFGTFPESDKVFPNSGGTAFVTGTGWQTATLAWAVIWKAIHSSPAGSRIYIPCGTYITRPQILTKANITITGESAPCAVVESHADGWDKTANGSQRGIFSVDSISGLGNYGNGVTIENLKIVSTYSTAPSTAATAVFVGGAANVTLRNLIIVNTPEPVWQGGQAQQNPGLRILDSEFIDTWGLQMTCKDCVARGNYIHWDNVVSGSAGISTTGQNVQIVGNRIIKPDGFGIYAGDNTNTGSWVVDNTVVIDAVAHTGGVRACFSPTIGSLLTVFKDNRCTVLTNASTGLGKAKGGYARYYGEVHFIDNVFEFKPRESLAVGFSTNDKVDVKEDQGDTFADGDEVYVVSLFPTAAGLNEATKYYVVGRGSYYSSNYYTASIQLSLTLGGAAVDITSGWSGYIYKNTTTIADGITISPAVVANQNNQGTIRATISGNVFKYRRHSTSAANKVIDLTIKTGAVGIVHSRNNIIDGLGSNNSYAVYLPKEVSNVVSSFGDTSTTAASWVVDTRSWYSDVAGQSRFDGSADFPLMARAAKIELLNIGAPITKTIASDAITLTGVTAGSGADCRSRLLIDTEGSAASDDLATITGCASDGNVLVLGTANSSRDVTLVTSGNIGLAAPLTLGTTSQRIELIYSSALTKWVPLAHSAGLSQTIVVKGSDGNNCNLVMINGQTVSTTCP